MINFANKQSKSTLLKVYVVNNARVNILFALDNALLRYQRSKRKKDSLIFVYPTTVGLKIQAVALFTALFYYHFHYLNQKEERNRHILLQ